MNEDSRRGSLFAGSRFQDFTTNKEDTIALRFLEFWVTLQKIGHSSLRKIRHRYRNRKIVLCWDRWWQVQWYRGKCKSNEMRLKHINPNLNMWGQIRHLLDVIITQEPLNKLSSLTFYNWSINSFFGYRSGIFWMFFIIIFFYRK